MIAAKAKKPVMIWNRKNKEKRLDEGGELIYINHGWTKRVNLMVAKEFRYKCSKTQSTFAVLNTVMRWTMFRVIFGSKKMEKVCVDWQNEGWTKVTTIKDWEKVKNQVVE